MKINISSFEEALNEAKGIAGKRQLLLGNGFSIACHDRFKYGMLFEQAVKKGLPIHLIELLKRHGNNFEDALKSLDDGQYLQKLYKLQKQGKGSPDMKKDYDRLKMVLVESISENHPESPDKIHDNKFKSCMKFLVNFDAIFSLNYDLLLYWASLHVNREKKEEFPFNDGFCREDDPKNPDCSFSYSSMDRKPYVFFLHGGLHLYTENGLVWKRVWNDTTIMQQVRAALDKRRYPLFVAEGDCEDKIKKIESSSYLSQAYRKFKNIQSHLFIFGHSLCDQDKHILYAIIHPEKYMLKDVWVGLFGDKNSKENKEIIRKAESLKLQRDMILPVELKKEGKGYLNIHYFQSETANVWLS